MKVWRAPYEGYTEGDRRPVTVAEAVEQRLDEAAMNQYPGGHLERAIARVHDLSKIVAALVEELPNEDQKLRVLNAGLYMSRKFEPVKEVK